MSIKAWSLSKQVKTRWNCSKVKLLLISRCSVCQSIFLQKWIFIFEDFLQTIDHRLIDHLDDGINISRSESDGKLCMSQVEDRYRNFIVEKIFSIKISFYTQSGILKKYFISLFLLIHLLRIYVRISFISRTGDDLHTRHSYYCFLLSFHLPGAGFENIIDCLNFPLIERICHTGLNKMYPR